MSKLLVAVAQDKARLGLNDVSEVDPGGQRRLDLTGLGAGPKVRGDQRIEGRRPQTGPGQSKVSCPRHVQSAAATSRGNLSR